MANTPWCSRTRSLTAARSNELMRASVTVGEGGRPTLHISDGPLHAALDVVVDGHHVGPVSVGPDGTGTVELPPAGRRVAIAHGGNVLASGPIPDRALRVSEQR